MTVSTHFDSWQNGNRYQPGPPYSGSPNARALMDFERLAYGGTNLGVNVNIRPIRAGQTWSDHAFGGAGDWGYGDGRVGSNYGGPGREWFVEEYAPWLIQNSLELGLQRIHDYFGDRIWQAGRTGNIAQAFKEWWKKQNGAGAGMGEAWATYVHNATSPAAYFNGVPILQRPGITPAPSGIAPPPVDWNELARIDREMRATVYPGTPLRKGDRGRPVEAAQWCIHAWGDPIAVDGQFGPKTEAAVQGFQRASGITADGIIGPNTWARLGLAMPAPPDPTPPPPPPAGAVQYRVQPGDGWWRIAERTTWDAPRWKEIAEHNGGEGRPLRVGDIILVPMARATVVQPGDGWIKVAGRLGREWHEVEQRNAWQGAVLHPGMVIYGGRA